MKFIRKISFSIVIILSFSCNYSIKKKENTNNVSPKNEFTDNFKSNRKTKDTLYFEKYDKKISGIYYSKSLRAEKGFYLTKKKPKSDLFLYELNFKNGNIEFEDLTKFYDCGNGVLSWNKSTYRKNNNGIYEIQINGKYAYESSFQIKGEYNLLINKEKELFFYPLKITDHKK